jgi:hypothetical protein
MELNDQVSALITSNVIFVGAFIGKVILDLIKKSNDISEREQDRLDREQDRLDINQLSTLTKEQLSVIHNAGSLRERNIISEIKKIREDR